VPKPDPLALTAEIVAAFVSNKSLPAGELYALVEGLHATLRRCAGTHEVTAVPIEPPTPAVPISESITPEYLICLEDGKRFKSMRRHLTLLGMTPERYRRKWGLPGNYPMVAPKLTERRMEIAIDTGFGLSRRKDVTEPAEAENANRWAKSVAVGASARATRRLTRGQAPGA